MRRNLDPLDLIRLFQIMIYLLIFRSSTEKKKFDETKSHFKIQMERGSRKDIKIVE